MKNIESFEMTNDVAYFMGLWIAEGSFEKNIGRITITCGDREAIEWLVLDGVMGLKFKWRREDQVALNSYEFFEMMRFIGMPMVKAPKKTIPDWVMNGSREWALNFIAGMWDGDGHVCSSGAQRAGYTSASRELVEDLQILLQNIGIIARATFDHITPRTKKVNKECISHRLSVTGDNLEIFRREIPLRIKRKAASLEKYIFDRRNSHRRVGNIPNQLNLIESVWAGRTKKRIKDGGEHETNIFSLITQIRNAKHGVNISTIAEFVDRVESYVGCDEESVRSYEALKKNISDDYHWDVVKSIDIGEAHTYDFTVPDTHSFYSDGFISHNTPKSFNHLYDNWILGQDGIRRLHDWKSWQFTTAMSPFVPASEMQRARAAMDEKSFNQEYLASFETMSGRVYYPFDRKIHTGDYPFNPQLPIYIGQDFNIDPMSSIIFQIQDSGEVWVVDEIVLYGSNTEETCDEIERRYWRSMKNIIIYPDPAGGARQHARGETDLDIFREKNLKKLKYHRKHPAIADRVNSVNRMLRSADGGVRLRVNAKCKHMIESFEQTIYKEGSREINKTMGVEHACFHGDQNVMVNEKEVKFRDIPKEGVVMGHDGVYRKYVNGGLMKKSVPMVLVILSNGVKIRCTDDHPFLTTDGWVMASNIQGKTLCNQRLLAKLSKSMRGKDTIFAEVGIFKKMVKGFIEKCGAINMAKFLRASTYITLTMTGRTMRLKILNLWRVGCMSVCTLQKTRQNSPARQEKRQQNGTEAMRDIPGISHSIKTQKTHCRERTRSIAAKSAGLSLQAQRLKRRIFAQEIAKQTTGERAGLIMRQEIAAFVEEALKRTNIQRQGHAVGGVRTLSVQRIEPSDSYCLTVDGFGMFEVGGVVVSNSDAAGYFLQYEFPIRKLVVAGISI